VPSRFSPAAPARRPTRAQGSTRMYGHSPRLRSRQVAHPDHPDH
jgi:hypothetical protein